jgi:hypothetical protein
VAFPNRIDVITLGTSTNYIREPEISQWKRMMVIRHFDRTNSKKPSVLVEEANGCKNLVGSALVTEIKSR